MEDSAFPRAYDKMHTSKRPQALIILVTFLGILAVLIYVGTRFLGTGIDGENPEEETSPTTAVVPSATPSEEDGEQTTPAQDADSGSEGEEELDRSSLSIQILNGSGISGAAGEISTYLEDLGYTDITTGNAETFDYEDISISVTSTKANFLELLETDLSDSYTIGDTDTDLSSGSYDAVIIVGQ